LGKKLIVAALIIACVAAAFAVPYFTGAFDDEASTEDQSSTSQQGEDVDDVNAAHPDGSQDEASSSDGSPTEEAIVDDLIEASNPSSPASDTIRSRLDTLETAANGSVEPFDTPQPTTLYQATLAHPAHTQQDLRYVESLQPLPEDLDEALSRVVLAHGVATQMLSQSEAAPGTSLAASVTMATALDTAMPTLERYVGHPVWNSPSTDEAREASTVELETPSLEAGLVDLYRSLGYGDDTIEALEPEIDAAASQLGPEQSQALARLVAAQAHVQRAAANSILFLAMPASHPGGGAVDDATRTVDGQLEGSPLEDLTVATEQLRAAAQQANDAFHENSPEDPEQPDDPEPDTPDEEVPDVREEPWTDPLGLIVVGTRGSDVYDARHGGQPTPLDAAVGAADGARATVGEVEANTSDTATTPATDRTADATATGEARVDAANQSTQPGPGWHMLVLDPGGDDVYRDNAGGIDAGNVLVELDLDASGGPEGTSDVLVRDGELCDPVLGQCEPRVAGTPAVGELLQLIATPGPTASPGTVPLGLPLTATVVDAGGDDTYEDTGDVIQGAARGLGVGVLADRDGDDSYEAGELAQGAAERFGIGILADENGTDSYHAEARAQGWVDLPNPNATAPVAVPGLPGVRAHVELARFTEGSLVDAGGNDTYAIDDEIAGQGVAEVPQGFARRVAEILGSPLEHEHITARLLDVGGEDQLPVPTVELRRDSVEMRPSRVNASGEQPAHFWLTRPVPEPPEAAATIFEEDATRYKTALHIDPGATANPIEDDAIRAGSVEIDCRESGVAFQIDPGDNTGSIAKDAACFSDFVETAELLLFGEPADVDDPPALTLTFGGDTHYNGSIASIQPSEEQRPGFDPRSNLNVPRLLTDLAGDDTYEGGNNTIASIEEASGAVMVVDREGSDVMDAGNRSIAYADLPLSGSVDPQQARVSAQAGAVAAVIDLDGDLTARSDEESQAFASRTQNTPITNANDVPMPPMALLAANVEPDQQEPSLEQPDAERIPGGLDLEAQNKSQAYSEGLGIAMLVGTPADDRYEVDGWGQGVHDGQQNVGRVCQLPREGDTGLIPENVPILGLVNAEDELSGLNPWLGGVSLVLDPDGDDGYRVDSGVGLGDAKMQTGSDVNCDRGSLAGPYNVNVLGLGSVIDARGQDSYELTETPPRPDGFSPRSCSGPNRTACEPHDDTAWMTIDETQALSRSVGEYEPTGVVGFGVDNVRNAHHLGAAACRNLDAFEPGPNAGVVPSAAENATYLECDEFVRQLWDAALGEAFSTASPAVDRTPDLEITLPSDDVAEALDSGQAAGTEDLNTGRIPLPADVGAPDDPEPLFLSDVGRPLCEQPEDEDQTEAGEVSPQGSPDLACLSVTREIFAGTGGYAGQWLTSDPAADRLDPGDTIGCNCSVRLQIEAQQGGSDVHLRKVTDGLYPDQGRVTTFTPETQTWYEAYNRFRVPLTVEDPVQDRLRGDFVQPEAAADFPLNLSQMPTGLANVQVTAVVEDAASEETGGLVPEEVQTWPRTIVHERTFEDAFVANHDGDRTLFLAAPGLVDAETRPTITVNATEDVRDELTGEDWTAVGETTFTHELPSTTVIDGPTKSPVVPAQGAPACAALLVEDDRDACWTGDTFVIQLELGETDLDRLETVQAGPSTLTPERLEVADSDAEPRPQDAFPEDYRIDVSDASEDLGNLDVHGIPGTEAVPEGKDLAEVLLDERPNENWALVTVEPQEGEAVGIAPRAFQDLGLNPHDPGDGGSHDDAHRVLGPAPKDHPHIELWVPPSSESNDADVVRDESVVFSDTERHVLGCASLNYANVDEVSRHLAAQADDNDLDLGNRTCVTFTDGDELSYLVPLGFNSGTQLVRMETDLLRTNGETVEKEQITAHIDPVGPRGQVSPDPTASRSTKTDVQLRVFPQTAEPPKLTSKPSTPDTDSDLVSVGLEARGANETNWTQLGDVWDRSPTPARPSVRASVNLSSLVPANASTSTVELRGVLQDESNNTIETSVREFVLDRAAPNVTEARVVTGADQSQLSLTVNEAVADVSCAHEECTFHANETVPGAEPEPFLDTTRLEIGARSITAPILDLQRGPTYTIPLEITDTLGNTATINVTVDTFSPLEVDASPMEDSLVNKTVTLNWTAETEGSRTLSTFTSAYLMLPDGPCPVLKANPNVVPADGVQSLEAGPLSVQGEVGERTCVVPDEGVDAELILYALAPNIGALGIDTVPVHVDTADPTVTLEGPDGWVNETVDVAARSNDSLPTELEIFVDEEPRNVRGAEGTVEVAEEGVHEVLARATDAAGNRALNATEVRIDRTLPTVSADVLGVRGGLALVNATAEDDPSSVDHVQLLTRSTAGPRVPDVGGQSVLLSVPVEPDEDEIVLRVEDQASNVQDLRLSIENVPRVESGPLVTGLDLATPAPDTLQASFETTNRTTPVIVVDAGDRHVEEALDPGRQHEITVDELPPGQEAQLTVTLPRGAELVPAVNASAPLPADNQPPTALSNVEAEPVEGGVELTWDGARDDVGVREVVVERDGTEVARTPAERYTDEPGTAEEHTYKLAAIDRAGNRGPWTEVGAEPIPTFSITEFTTSPETLTPEEPVTMEATVQTPAGLQPDVVTVSVGDQTLPMRPVEEGPYTATYQVQTRLPTLDVASQDTDIVVNATAGDRVETQTYPAPAVSELGADGSVDTDDVPAPGVLAVVGLSGLVALARRRWSR
jgi:hypothetical protein